MGQVRVRRFWVQSWLSQPVSSEFGGLRPVQGGARDWGILPERQPAKREIKGACTFLLSVHFSSLEDIERSPPEERRCQLCVRETSFHCILCDLIKLHLHCAEWIFPVTVPFGG